jgi:hypothetical protein
MHEIKCSGGEKRKEIISSFNNMYAWKLMPKDEYFTFIAHLKLSFLQISLPTAPVPYANFQKSTPCT